ncbi:ribonuclease HIII [Weizmannia acidilactici]|uniref:Ribonuclease HIII n=1 Tax=Weizmannia acidilactici TaxID=2607726 RepID=A0A5J4JET1_9BACI|nr:ribonuclease HIII [Weizmannia acidilactici]GER67044.1 ribonuclease HIII [Weizmannia acidilactici]GER70201.1 ribonuclease HIII [Weizmannia acidilactici]GER73239.1 ribonuclease HIII [Weizmannia acidilactici]
MSNTVILASHSAIQEMKEYYQTAQLNKIPAGAIFAAKIPGCQVTAYRSGKVLFQGPGGEAEAAKWGKAVEKKPASAKPKTSGNPLPPYIGSMSVIGSDEVGTGDYFGPITVASTYVKKDQIPLLKELGVKDSKGLADHQIASIAKELLHFIPYSLLVLPNEKYNRLQQSGMSQGKMKAMLHNRALYNLLQKIAPEKPDAILVDQFAEAPTYYRYLQNEKNVVRDNVFFSTKGESVHLAVAAASILARYAFVREFEKLGKEAGGVLPKGAGAQVDAACARLIKARGLDVLPHFVKLHFANTEKAKRIAGVK